MVKIMKESYGKSDIVFVARLDDGKPFYVGKLDDGFKWILKREMNRFWTVEDVVVRYLKSCGYADVDEFTDDELVETFIDEFIDEDGFVFDRYSGFTIEPAGLKPGEGPFFESVKRRNSRRTMKESYGDTRYEGRSYYGTNFSGIEDDLYTDDFSELEDWTWEKVNKGGCVEVVDTATGNRARLVLPEDSEYYDYIDTQDCIIWSDKYGDRDEKDVSLYQCLSESKKRSFDKKNKVK